MTDDQQCDPQGKQRWPDNPFSDDDESGHRSDDPNERCQNRQEQDRIGDRFIGDKLLKSITKTPTQEIKDAFPPG